MTNLCHKNSGINPVDTTVCIVDTVQSNEPCVSNPKTEQSPYRAGFDIETTAVRQFVSGNFSSWEMSGNFMEKLGKC